MSKKEHLIDGPIVLYVDPEEYLCGIENLGDLRSFVGNDVKFNCSYEPPKGKAVVCMKITLEEVELYE